MRLNDIRPDDGATKVAKRVGRGSSAGGGKTAGRGHKGQHSRSGGYHKTGFEGGQMPLQRRVPKVGFRSQKARKSAEVRLSELRYVEGDDVTLETLKAAKVIPQATLQAKIVLSGECDRAVTVKGVKVTKGAQAAIEKAGGKVEG